MLRPSIDRGEIEARQEAVEHRFEPMAREELRRRLKASRPERLLSRVTLETITRDVLALASSLDTSLPCMAMSRFPAQGSGLCTTRSTNSAICASVSRKPSSLSRPSPSATVASLLQR
jgi:hypothetical protein